MDFPIPIIWDEYTFVFGGIILREKCLVFISFFNENHVLQANRIAPDKTPRFARHNLGYSGCLCPIKRMPALYGLNS